MNATPAMYAAALGKICRYGGRSVKFYSVLLHSFCVADLVEPRFRLLGLMHDVCERETGDTCSDFKSAEQRHAEHRLFDDVCKRLGIPRMTLEAHRAVKVADLRARNGEVWCDAGDSALRRKYPVRDREAEKLTLHYLHKFPAADTINPRGRAIREFVRRFKTYRKDQRRKP